MMLQADALPVPPPARGVPMSFAASLKSWWSVGEKESAYSEERLLRRLPFWRGTKPADIDTKEPLVAYSTKVPLATDPTHYLNTLTMESTAPRDASSPPPAVLLHGYGAGLGFYFRNFDALSSWADRRKSSVHAVDWLGMGRSSRVPFSIKAKREDLEGRTKEAESFFIDSLEDWRKTQKLETMTLIGHSLGAYFSVVYALKYPERVHRLILLSPAGVPRDDSSIPAQELTEEQETAGPNDGAEQPSFQKVNAMKKDQKVEKQNQTRTRKIFTYLWEEGFSPFSLARSTTVWAPMLIGKYSSRRFSGLSEEETRDMHDYILNITLAKGSGEYCISHILAPGAHARFPLVDRINKLKIPVTFVYGDHDWMDAQGGTQSVEALRQAGNGQGRMYVVKNAGHHVYLDNPKATNDLMIKELDRDLV